jgi:hypothetical protein
MIQWSFNSPAIAHRAMGYGKCAVLSKYTLVKISMGPTNMKLPASATRRTIRSERTAHAASFEDNFGVSLPKSGSDEDSSSLSLLLRGLLVC